MEYFKKEELIRCYRERKEDRCPECRLQQRASRLPGATEENLEALVTEVLDPARRKLGKPITVNSGFRCPLIVYENFLHVSWKRVGENRRQVLKKVGNGYVPYNL